MMRDIIQQRITDRAKRLADIDAERVIIQSEIRIYNDVLSLIPEEISSVNLNRNLTDRPGRRAFNWFPVIAEAGANAGQVFDLDRLSEIARKSGASPTRGNIRSQMAAYVTRNLIERVSEGLFRLTEEGRLQLLLSDDAELGDEAAAAGNHLDSTEVSGP